MSTSKQPEPDENHGDNPGVGGVPADGEIDNGEEDEEENPEDGEENRADNPGVGGVPADEQEP